MFVLNLSHNYYKSLLKELGRELNVRVAKNLIIIPSSIGSGSIKVTQLAKVLLLSHKYSIKEIGLQLGYANFSNFSIAFKKEFNLLPSKLQL